MHELSIAVSILEGVEEEVSRGGYGTVNAIHIRVGVLSGVVPAALLSAFEMARVGTSFAQSTLRIEDAPALLRCSHCGQDSPVTSIQAMSCPACEHPPAEIIGGQELEVTGLELAT